MVFCVFIFIFIFLFRSNVRKGYLDESDFRHSYGNFFRKIKLLDRSYVKVSSQQYEGHWQQHFERHPTVEDFTDMDQETC